MLNVPFEPHDSSFFGEYCLAYREDQNERFERTENFNPIEEEWDFPDLKEYPLILQISLSKRSVDRLQEVENTLEKLPDLNLKQPGSLKTVFIKREEEPD